MSDSSIVNSDVIIVGAGASGMFCASECGKRGRKVVVLDHADRACSKVLISGGGRCNFTNLRITAENYLSENPHFCRSALARFTPHDIVALIRKHKIPFAEKEAGQLFCATSSHDVVRMLGRECEHSAVDVRLKHRIMRINKEGSFVVSTDHGEFTARSLVIAAGGLSFPKLGASGFGHDIARKFGHSITELRPALVPFTVGAHERDFCQKLAGVSITASVRSGTKVFRGGLLFTHRGLSGPAALQASSYWEPGNSIVIDVFPDMDIGAILQRERRNRMELKNLLSKYVPRRFAEAWCDGYFPSKPIIQYNEKELAAMADMLHEWNIVPSGTEGYSVAEATKGGVNTREVSSKTMESNLVEGLYFTGEVLDVTGHLGGYNLHWAWASGYAAGQYA